MWFWSTFSFLRIPSTTLIFIVLFCSEGIYENAAVLKSSNMSFSADITTLEKYEFGNETINNSTDDFNEEDEEEIEEPAGDDLDSDSDIKTEPVSFQVW